MSTRLVRFVVEIDVDSSAPLTILDDVGTALGDALEELDPDKIVLINVVRETTVVAKHKDTP